MIKIVLLSLLTLSLSCAQATPPGHTEQSAVLTAAAPTAPEAAAPVLPEQEPERPKSHKQVTKTISSQPTAATLAIPEDPASPASLMEQPAAETLAVLSAEELETTPDYQAVEIPANATIADTSTEEPALSGERSFSEENPFSPELLETPRKKKRDTPFLPTRRRIDREINKIKYVQKGEIMMGLTASYGTLSSDDAEMWLVLDNINLDASIFTVNPFLGYFFRDNMCLGARFGYSQINGNLASAAINLGEANDINLAVNDIKLANENISFGVFLRSYAGLDAKGHFGLFGELELTMSSGSSEFSYMSGGDPHQTFGDNTKLKLSFNPGMAVYIFPNVCSTISFGLGGIQYTKTTQKDAEGNKIGSRTSSNMRFRLNLAEIRIGLTIHLWNKKKSL